MSSILALDIGESRIGVAIASRVARLPRPLTTMENSVDFWPQIKNLAKSEEVDLIVIGLPRNLSGQDTAQTAYVREFVRGAGDLQIAFQDEALTSKKAESELKKRGKAFTKADIDALAATYILEDYLNQRAGQNL